MCECVCVCMCVCVVHVMCVQCMHVCVVTYCVMPYVRMCCSQMKASYATCTSMGPGL